MTSDDYNIKTTGEGLFSDNYPWTTFIDEFELSPKFMVSELKNEFDIVMMCLRKSVKSDKHDRELYNRILATSIRKLLFDGNKSTLKIVCESFKMPSMGDKWYETYGKLRVLLPSMDLNKKDDWCPLESWRNQKIAILQ